MADYQAKLAQYKTQLWLIMKPKETSDKDLSRIQ